MRKRLKSSMFEVGADWEPRYFVHPRGRGGENYIRDTIWSSTTTHVKEILAADMDGDGRMELFAAVEAERSDDDRHGQVQIIELIWQVDGNHSWRQVAEIDDDGLRFMQAHDVDGQMPMELFLAPRNVGLYLMEWQAEEPGTLWQIDSESGGFEHAIQIFDFDQDGRAELYVASDHEKSLVRFQWTLP